MVVSLSSRLEGSKTEEEKVWPLARTACAPCRTCRERLTTYWSENHFIIVMIRWTGLAPWAVEFPFPGSLTSTFRAGRLFRELLLLSSLELSDTKVYEA